MIRRKLQVIESLQELEKLYYREKTPRKKKKLHYLLLVKKGQLKRHIDLSGVVGVKVWSLSHWKKKYQSGGIEALLEDKSGGYKMEIVITKEIADYISLLLNDPTSEVLGYDHLRQILIKKFHLSDLNYNTLRKHCITRHKSKLKVPRKSHYKSEEKAREAFLKTR